MAGAQFNARPQLTAAVKGLAAITEGSQGRPLPRALRVTEEDERGEECWEKGERKKMTPAF